VIAGFSVQWASTGEDAEDGFKRMAVAFERAGNELQDFGKYLFPKLTPLFEQEMRDQFSAQGRGPDAGTWAPLSEQYAAWKEQHHPGQPILQATGTLHQALTSSGSPFARRVTSGDTFDFGTTGVEYASYHQLGTSEMPARPPVDLGSDFERLLLREGEAAAREAMEAAGATEFAEVTS
jgi:phage gpG-like protein